MLISGGAFVCANLAKLPEVPSSSELGLATEEMVGDKQGRGKAEASLLRGPSQWPGIYSSPTWSLTFQFPLPCLWSRSLACSFSDPRESPSSSSVQVHVQVCSTGCGSFCRYPHGGGQRQRGEAGSTLSSLSPSPADQWWLSAHQQTRGNTI